MCVVSVLIPAGTVAGPATRPIEGLEGRVKVGSMDRSRVRESSGIVASRQFEGVFWTHNDSGHAAELFAIDRAGTLLAAYEVAGENVDWEDIATDDAGRLYVADTGNNRRTRQEVRVLVLQEPDPAAGPGEPLALERVFRLHYPRGGAFECEAFFVHEGQGYLVSKQFDGRHATLYRFDLANEEPVQTLEAAGEVPVRSPITAADISPDGKWLALMTVTGPTVFQVDGDPGSMDDGASYSRFSIDALSEAITYTAEGLVATNEGGTVWLFKWDRGIDQEG